MPSPFDRLIHSLRDNNQRLNSPHYQSESNQDDLNPRNLYSIDQEMTRAPLSQQDTLMRERRRLEQMQTQQIMQASKNFQPQMAKSLELPKIPSFADVMMQMMGNRQPPPGIPGVSGAQVQRDQPYTGNNGYTGGMVGVRN